MGTRDCNKDSILHGSKQFSKFQAGSGWPPASRLEESPGTAGHDAG